MKVRYREEVALTLTPSQFGMPTLLGETEGNTKHRVIASDGLIPRGRGTFARQEVLYTEAVRSQVCPVKLKPSFPSKYCKLTFTALTTN